MTEKFRPKFGEPRSRLEIGAEKPLSTETLALEALETVDSETAELEKQLDALESLPLNSEDVLLAVEADTEIGLTANVNKFKNRLEEVSIDFHVGVAEVLAPEEITSWDPAKELSLLKSRIRETRKLVGKGELDKEVGKRQERWLQELYKAEYIRQQEAIRQLQERLINAANNMLVTSSGLTLRELDEACRDETKAKKLMDKAGTNDLADLFVISEDNVDYDLLLDMLESGANRARLTEKQKGLFRRGLDIMFARHDKASELVRKLGHGRELAAAIMRTKPKDIGEVQVFQGFGTLYFRFQKPESFARFASSKFDPDTPLTENEKDFATHTGGVSVRDAPEGLEELAGGLMGEKAQDKPYDHNQHLIKLHETQHALRRVYPSLDLRKSSLILQAIDENTKENPNLGLIADAVESGARNQRISEIDPSAHDEILAYFSEGMDTFEIYNILTTSPVYDYYARDKEGFQSTGSTLTALDDEFRAQIIDRVFGDEYRGEIYRALQVIERMQELGMKNLEIRTALLIVPLIKWPTFLKRLMEQRYKEKRKSPDYKFLGDRLEELYQKIEQDIESLRAQGGKPEALKAGAESVQEIYKAKHYLQDGKIEECVELLEEALGEKSGGQSGILGWEGVRKFARDLYKVLDNRPGLPAYSFETEKMTLKQAAETVVSLLYTTMRQDDWWRIEREISLENFDQVKDDLRDMAEVGLSTAIKDKRAGQLKDNTLRRLRSALRVLSH